MDRLFPISSCPTRGVLAMLAERVACIEGRNASGVLSHAAMRAPGVGGTAASATTAAAPATITAEPVAPAITATTVATAAAIATTATTLGRPADPERVPTGWTAMDDALGGGLLRRGVHEWWLDSTASDRASLLGVLVHMAWQALLHDEHHCPGTVRRVVWIGRAVWPHATDLIRGLRVGSRAAFGARCPRHWPDARLLRRSLVVDAEPRVRAWAIEQAVRCPGVCAVVADGAGFDMPATRRLQLAAADTLLLLVRPMGRTLPPSVALTRWVVRHEPRGASLVEGVHPARPPHDPEWVVELQRIKCGDAARAGTAARVTHAWQWEGTAEPPGALVAEAERRRRRREARVAAHAERALERHRQEEQHAHEINAAQDTRDTRDARDTRDTRAARDTRDTRTDTTPVSDHTLLHGHHASGMEELVRAPRRLRRAR